MAGQRYFQPGKSEYQSQFIPTILPFEAMDKKLQEVDARVDKTLSDISAVDLDEVNAAKSSQLVGQEAKLNRDKNILFQDGALAKNFQQEFMQKKQEAINTVINGDITKNNFSDVIRDLSSQQNQVNQVFSVLNNRKKSLEEAEKKLESQKDLANSPHIARQYNENLKNFADVNSLEDLMSKESFGNTEFGVAISNRISLQNALGAGIQFDANDKIYGYDDLNALVNGKKGWAGVTPLKAWKSIYSTFKGSELENDNILKTEFWTENGNIVSEAADLFNNSTDDAIQLAFAQGLISDKTIESFKKSIQDEKPDIKAAKEIYKGLLDAQDLLGIFTKAVFNKNTHTASQNKRRAEELVKQRDEVDIESKLKIGINTEVEDNKKFQEEQFEKSLGNFTKVLSNLDPNQSKDILAGLGISVQDIASGRAFEIAKNKINVESDGTITYGNKDLNEIIHNINTSINSDPTINATDKDAYKNEINSSLTNIVYKVQFDKSMEAEILGDPNISKNMGDNFLNTTIPMNSFQKEILKELAWSEKRMQNNIDWSNPEEVEQEVKKIVKDLNTKVEKDTGDSELNLYNVQGIMDVYNRSKSEFIRTEKNKQLQEYDNQNAWDQIADRKITQTFTTSVDPVTLSNVPINDDSKKALMNHLLTNGLAEFLDGNVADFTQDEKQFINKSITQYIESNPDNFQMLNANTAIIPIDVLIGEIVVGSKTSSKDKPKEGDEAEILTRFHNSVTKSKQYQDGSVYITTKKTAPLTNRTKNALNSSVFESAYNQSENLNTALIKLNNFDNTSYLSFNTSLSQMEQNQSRYGKFIDQNALSLQNAQITYSGFNVADRNGKITTTPNGMSMNTNVKVLHTGDKKSLVIEYTISDANGDQMKLDNIVHPISTENESFIDVTEYYNNSFIPLLSKYANVQDLKKHAETIYEEVGN